MRVLIFGTGGVGGYFGARMAEAGMDVIFLARGDHFEALNNKGLILKSINGDLHLHPIKAVKDTSGVTTEIDLIILGVKAYQIETTTDLLQPIISKNTIILPLQNGVEVVDQLLRRINKKNIIAGFCKIYTKIEGPGIIRHFAHDPELLIGELDNSKSPRIIKLKKELDKAKFKTTIPEDIHAELWKKFMFICSVSGMGALTRITIGEMYESESIRHMIKKTAQEIYELASSKEIILSRNTVNLILHFIEKQPYDSTSSLQRDMMAEKPSELENFNGYIVKEAPKYGLETPINGFIYQCLLPQELKARSKN